MDLNSGLTQALSDGTNTYVYGVGRIAQVSTGTEYFLGDALGSVRQLTNNSGTITYARAYDPYGVVTSASGASSTAYGYTGEFTSNDLVYLRARYYAPGTGRFLTRDTWEGDANNPMSFNRWNYVNSNPINYTDPSGHCPAGMVQNPDGTCTFTFPEIILPPFGITIGGWTIAIPWCNDQTTILQQPNATPTVTPQPYTPTPGSISITTTPIQTQVQSTTTPAPSVMVYRGLSRKDKKPATNAGEFAWHPPYGVSTFELAVLPGVKPYMIGYTVLSPEEIELDSGEKVIRGRVSEVSACFGTYDPPPAGHWSIDCGGPGVTPSILSTDAKARKATIVPNPNYRGP